MNQNRKLPRILLGTGLAVVTSLAPLPLLAQTETETPTEEVGGLQEASVVETEKPAMPPAPVLDETGKMAAAEPAPAPVAETPTVAEEAAPSASDEPLSVSVWGRLGNAYSNPKDSKGETFVNAEVDLILSGKVHEYVGWQADFVATYGTATGTTDGTITGSAEILDLIGKFELHDAFNVWFGRMLVPSDRSNFSGAWFISPWNYPGFYDPAAAPVGPRQGPFGRNNGATVWGQFGGGMLKYYAGAFDLHLPQQSPLFSGRINLSLLNPEPGYYNSSTYYGGKDIVALGFGAQYKKDGSVQTVVPEGMVGMAADYTGFNADLLVEKTLGGAGTLTFEAAAYFFDGDFEAIDNHFFGLVSYLLPGEIGIGRLQPLVRYQLASPSAEGEDAWKVLDAQLGYAIEEYSARVALGYQNIDAGALESNSVFLGIQLMK